MEYFRQRFIDELNQEGDIEIRGVTWSRQEVLQSMDSQAYEDNFREWTDQAKEEAKQRTLAFLTENGCLPRFQRLMHRLHNGHVVPFVGAGMSIATGFPPWGAFLQSLLADAPHEAINVQAMLAIGEYEEAAQYVYDILTPGVFDAEIAERMGSHRLDACGSVNLLPSLFRGEVITTNFDYVLMNAYSGANHPFSSTICGQELRSAPARLGNDNHALLRLHGEADTAAGRVLTLREYETVYVEGRELKGMLASVIGIRSFLFLGCSLTADRTLQALAQIKAEAGVDSPPNFAFLPLPEEGQRLERRTFLEQAGIHPIYYPPDAHETSVEDLLITMMEGGH
jgi:SIR2-like domain